jgi:hypothetical protein
MFLMERTLWSRYEKKGCCISSAWIIMEVSIHVIWYTSARVQDGRKHGILRFILLYRKWPKIMDIDLDIGRIATKQLSRTELINSEFYMTHLKFILYHAFLKLRMQR